MCDIRLAGSFSLGHRAHFYHCQTIDRDAIRVSYWYSVDIFHVYLTVWKLLSIFFVLTWTGSSFGR
jgi:hypothetical protein